MSDHVIGVVQKITEKATRNGGTIYNVCLDTGQDDEWFGHGFDEPNFGEGDEIEFDISYNGDYANVDPDTVEIISEGERKSNGNGRGNSRGNSRSKPSSKRSSSSSRGGSKSSSRSKPAARRSSAKASTDDKMSKDDWAKKDKMIQLQSAMNTAIALCSAAVANDLVALPAKKADKFDAFAALVDEEAERLHKQYLEQVYGKPASKRGGRSTRDDEDEYDDDIPQ